ncbi:MAG: UDP-N-acetylglucosamine 2-epimerase (hydrolyzing) [Bacteroidetes bacterium]|nr:UDP-N-acetylglucosamine 2-epimerase (hydrolyzing) [Bacteroidota bacterium]
MGGFGMTITFLTSSRADYGIYLPLLKKIKADSFFSLKIIAFGTHLSKKHGETIQQIYADGFDVAYKIDTLLDGDTPLIIAQSMAKTMAQFAEIWEKEKDTTDLIFCLGDRFEMFAAVSASVPFNIPIAHLHGGETTLGAIDEVFRHSLTSMSKLHFASTEKHKKRVEQILGHSKLVFNVGALSIDNLNDLQLYSKDAFKEKFGIELNNPILVTFHPETKSYEKNEFYIDQLLLALMDIEQQLIFTMPNADTSGNIIREKINLFVKKKSNAYVVESFGTQGYFSCIAHCSFVLGNSSSGIIEAASFGKYVINLGARQQGRDVGANVFHCEIDSQKIKDAIISVKKAPVLSKKNIYGDGKASDIIIERLKTCIL